MTIEASVLASVSERKAPSLCPWRLGRSSIYNQLSTGAWPSEGQVYCDENCRLAIPPSGWAEIGLFWGQLKANWPPVREKTDKSSPSRKPGQGTRKDQSGRRLPYPVHHPADQRSLIFADHSFEFAKGRISESYARLIHRESIPQMSSKRMAQISPMALATFSPLWRKSAFDHTLQNRSKLPLQRTRRVKADCSMQLPSIDSKSHRTSTTN
jgi:hypothetical protein